MQHHVHSLFDTWKVVGLFSSDIDVDFGGGGLKEVRKDGWLRQIRAFLVLEVIGTMRICHP